LIDARTAETVPLVTLLRDPRFSLFVRAGAAADAALELVRARFGEDVAVRVVLDADRSAPDWADSVRLDPASRLLADERIDALLVRPDGHLAAALARGQAGRVLPHLERTLGPGLERDVARPLDALR
jgi:hypothetical protein